MANTPLGLWSYVSDPFIEYVSSYLRSSIETRGLYKPSQIPRIPITPTQHRINNQANSLSNTKPFQFHLPKHNEALHHLFRRRSGRRHHRIPSPGRQANLGSYHFHRCCGWRIHPRFQDGRFQPENQYASLLLLTCR